MEQRLYFVEEVEIVTVDGMKHNTFVCSSNVNYFGTWRQFQTHWNGNCSSKCRQSFSMWHSKLHPCSISEYKWQINCGNRNHDFDPITIVWALWILTYTYRTVHQKKWEDICKFEIQTVLRNRMSLPGASEIFPFNRHLVRTKRRMEII